jgi:hypothetical protein
MLLAPALALALLSGPPAPDDRVDISSVRENLRVLDDGHEHFLVLVPFGDMYEHFYWGDGKDFWAIQVFGGMSSGEESFDRNFWDPRIRNRSQAAFSFRNGKYTLQCAERETTFHPSDPKRQEEILKSGTFHSQRWKRRAYALARDNGGTYFYVDRPRKDETMDFRLWSGPRGAMKSLRMTNVVSDSAGDVFATKGGDLKLVLGKNEASWVQGKKAKDLILLPLAENAQLIYGDLGVYTGQPLGTPCDLL